MNLRALALISFFAVLAACYGMAQTGATTADERTTLRVDNQSFSDMTIYAARSGQRTRLGTAPGHSSSFFTVPSGLLGGMTSLRFIADPIGSSRASVSEEIIVTPGDSVVLVIPP